MFSSDWREDSAPFHYPEMFPNEMDAGLIPIFMERAIINVPYRGFGSYFEALAPDIQLNGCLDTIPIIRRIHSYLRPFSVRLHVVFKVLRFLFGLFKPRSSLWSVGLGSTLYQRLRSIFKTDLTSFPSSGLAGTRMYFLILSTFAKRSASTPLADALVRFFRSNGLEINRCERSKDMVPWTFALCELHGLVPIEYLEDCRRYLLPHRERLISEFPNFGLHDHRIRQMTNMFFDMVAEPAPPVLGFERGRRHRRAMCLRDMPRALTAPPVFRHRGPQRFLMPRMIPRGDPFGLVIIEPVRAPVLLAPPQEFGVPVDEIDAIKWKQRHLQHEMRDLDEDIAMVEMGAMR